MARRPARAAPSRDETAYQKRIREYKERHPGATTQEARGKRAGEHVERKRREVATGGLTDYEKRRTREFGRDHARRTGADPARAENEALQWARREGYGAVKQARDEIRRLARQRSRRLAGPVVTIGGRARNIGAMENFAGDHDLPDWTWLFYH